MVIIPSGTPDAGLIISLLILVKFLSHKYTECIMQTREGWPFKKQKSYVLKNSMRYRKSMGTAFLTNSLQVRKYSLVTFRCVRLLLQAWFFLKSQFKYMIFSYKYYELDYISKYY